MLEDNAEISLKGMAGIRSGMIGPMKMMRPCMLCARSGLGSGCQRKTAQACSENERGRSLVETRNAVIHRNHIEDVSIVTGPDDDLQTQDGQ